MPEMLLRKTSPLEVTLHEGKGFTLAEAPDFTLTQVAGDESALKSISAQTILRITPKQLWVLGAPPQARNGIYVTPLSSSRTRLHLTGEHAREILARCAAIDFANMKTSEHVLTGIHHTPVLIHCIGVNEFHIYAMRTFAQTVWNWLVDVSEGLPPLAEPHS
jgi:heterotetrameric sarcosine oxidase gamma subunit